MIAARPFWTAIGLVVLCCTTFLQGISTRGLWASHEARAAQNAQSILLDGDWLAPRLFDGQVELQKPAGIYWLIAIVGALRGEVDAVAVRLPVAMAGTITVLMVWHHLHQRGRPIAGLITAIALASAIHYTGTARIGRIDVPLGCAVCATLFLARERELRLAPCAGLAAALALLLKGPIGLALPGLMMLVWQCVDPKPWRQTLRFVIVATVIAMVLGLPWYVAINRRTDGEFVRVFVLYHHFNRAFGGAEALAAHPWWYYLPRFAVDFLPWSPLLLLAILRRSWRGDRDVLFGLVWLGVMLALLSASRFKRADYLIPAYPGAAIVVGCWLEQWYLRRSQGHRKLLALSLALFALCVPVATWVYDRTVTQAEQASRDQAAFADVVRQHAPSPAMLYLFQVEAHQFTFHAGRPVHTLVEWHDLASPLEGLGPHFVVTRADLELDLSRRFDGVVLARSADLVPASIKPHRPLVLIRVESGPHPWPKPPKD